MRCAITCTRGLAYSRTLDPLRTYADAAKALGVRAEVEQHDYVSIISRIASAADGQHLEPKEERAVVFALRELQKSSAPTAGSKPLELSLFVEDEGKQRLVSADRLVWPDRVELEYRCTQLKEQLGFEFAAREYAADDEDDKPIEWDCQRLSELTALRPLSSLLSEGLQEEPERLLEVAPEEQALEQLLKSSEFASGSRTCLAEHSPLSPECGQAHDQMFTSLEIRWTSCKLTSSLYAPEQVRLEGSEKTALAFADGSTLWLQLGILEGQDDERRHQLLSDVQSCLFQMLHAVGVTATHRHFQTMLDCKDPAAIPAALRAAGVKAGSTLVKRDRKPGAAIDVSDYHLLQQATHFTFRERSRCGVDGRRCEQGAAVQVRHSPS